MIRILQKNRHYNLPLEFLEITLPGPLNPGSCAVRTTVHRTLYLGVFYILE